MAYIDGNLALKKKRVPVSLEPTQPVKRCPTIKARRIPVTATPSPDEAVRLRVRAIRRELAQRRLRLLVTMVGLVLFVAAVFAVVVYRQARILEMNFAAVAMEQQISQYSKESSQIRESLAQKTNLDQIRQQAISRLGLQDPARSQMIRVHVPNTDRVVYAAQGVPGTEDDTYLSGVFTSIETYFRTIRIGDREE